MGAKGTCSSLGGRRSSLACLEEENGNSGRKKNRIHRSHCLPSPLAGRSPVPCRVVPWPRRPVPRAALPGSSSSSSSLLLFVVLRLLLRLLRGVFAVLCHRRVKTRERDFSFCAYPLFFTPRLSLFSSLRKAWKLPFSSPFVCLLITSFQHIGSRSSPESYPSLKQQQKTCQVPEAELISSLNFFFCRKTERYERVERIERFERTERIERDRDRDREITYRICSPDNFFPELARRNSAAACSGFQKALTRIQKQANFAIRQLRRRRRQINLHSPCVNHQKKKILIIGLKLMRTSF